MPKRSITQIVFVLFVLTVSLLLVGCGEDGDAPAATTAATTDTTATTDNTDADPQSPAGGVPSASLVGVGVTKASMPFAASIGDEFDFSVYFKDRLHVYSGMVNSDNVHVRGEDGVASVENVVVADGVATITMRVHDAPAYSKAGDSWESELRTTLSGTDSDYQWSTGPPTGLPSWERVSVMWYTRGEEWFTEKAGNNHDNQFDIGEHYVDTEDDPYLDENENGRWDAEEPWTDTNDNGYYDLADTFVDTNSNGSWDWEEFFVDSNGNGERDGANGKWDSNKNIFGNVTFIMTSQGVRIGWDSEQDIDVPVTEPDPPTTLPLRVVVCDENMNHLPAGTKITFTSDKGNFVGDSVFTIPDNQALFGSDADTQLELITYEVFLEHSGTAGAAVITVAISDGGVTPQTATISRIVSLD